MNDLLTQKLDALNTILAATKRLKITGEGDDEQLEREAELFSSLYEQRAEVIEQIQKLDKEIEETSKGQEPDRKLLDKIRDTAKAIAELDRQHIAASEKLTVFLRGGLKQIRDGRDVSNAYGEDIGNTSGHYFDRTH